MDGLFHGSKTLWTNGMIWGEVTSPIFGFNTHIHQKSTPKTDHFGFLDHPLPTLRPPLPANQQPEGQRAKRWHIVVWGKKGRWLWGLFFFGLWKNRACFFWWKIIAKRSWKKYWKMMFSIWIAGCSELGVTNRRGNGYLVIRQQVGLPTLSQIVNERRLRVWLGSSGKSQTTSQTLECYLISVQT